MNFVENQKKIAEALNKNTNAIGQKVLRPKKLTSAAKTNRTTKTKPSTSRAQKIQRQVKQSEQQAQKINSEKISLLNHFGSVEKVDINKLITLASHLEYVNLSGIEDTIEEKVAGGVVGFLRKCTKMTDLKVEKANNLNYTDCTTLKSIEAPNVTELNCSGCPALTSITAPNATRLDCPDCTALTSIEAPKANILKCPGCTSLITINAPVVISIDCSKCPGLISIETPEAQALVCSECPKLISFETPKARVIKCNHCTALTSITAPKAENLECCDCPALTSIYIPNTQLLNCSGCSALTSIEALEAKGLECSECPALTSITAPKVKELSCRNCWSLNSISTPPSLFMSIKIQKEEMKENPEQYLSQLIPYFLVNKKWPQVKFIERDASISPGIDASGLSKDALTTLVQALFSEGNPTLKVDEELKPVLDVNLDDKPERPEDLLKWKAFGYIMGVVFKKSYVMGTNMELHLLTGRIFSPKAFETLKAAVLSDRDEKFKMHLVKTLYKDEVDKYKDNVDINVDEYLEAYIPSFIDPIIALADGIKAILNEEELATFAGLEPSAIQDRIEGTLSADAIIGKLKFEPETSETEKKVQGYLKNWINMRADNPEELKAFLIAVTGSPTISPTSDDIKISHRLDGFPKCHTCFNHLELPNVTSQEDFNNKMQEFFKLNSLTGSGFNDE